MGADHSGAVAPGQASGLVFDHYRQREVRCWARSEMARQLIRAAHAIGDRSITDTSNLCHNIYRWERGTVVPSERYKLYYCRSFGISPSEYGIDKTEIEAPVDDLAIAALDLLAAKLGLQRDFNGQTLIIRRELERPGVKLDC